MPQSEHEDVAAEPKSATGQYLKPLLERASVQPVKAQPSKAKARTSRKARGVDADADQPDLIAAK
jgi:excinuclease ABC subunit A